MRRYGLKVSGYRLSVIGCWLSVIVIALALCGCEDTTFRSSVPTYPVRVVIDTRIGQFVHFQPTDLSSYVVVNGDGYYMNEEYVLPVSAMDAWGYGGVLVYVSIFGYDAYDLACPNCAIHGRRQPCEINGMFAECPHCGEQYDLASGSAAPQKGLIREALRRLNIMNSDGKLTITQRQ